MEQSFSMGRAALWILSLPGEGYVGVQEYSHRGGGLYTCARDSFPVLKVTLPSGWEVGRCVNRDGAHGCGHQWHV